MAFSSETESHPRVDASPTKNFFVEMLTRDIDLKDAILDLLDNCVDGIQRNAPESSIESDKPYKNFRAEISFSKEGFIIKDNCGGIPIEVAQKYAFKMGRPEAANKNDAEYYTIGTYGIGMKRAIFKMGCSSQVSSQTASDSFKVTISPEWLSSDSEWDLPLEETDRWLPENGTVIEVTHLRDEIAIAFSPPQQSVLHNSLVGEISHNYSYIINKGFTVIVNGSEVPLLPLNLLADGIEQIKQNNAAAIAPFLYEAEKDGVEIKLAVGFYKDIPDGEEIDDEMKGVKNSSETSGWTVICNDRVVLYCDKSRLTGWGELTVPGHHPQFNAISGVIHFRSKGKDASKLPITTTKRGIDASSNLYLYVKEFMREGTKVFTSYTYKWKKNLEEEKTRTKQARLADPIQFFETIPKERWTQVNKRTSESRSFYKERKFTPTLPTPELSAEVGERKRKVSFSRPEKEIEMVAEYLFEDSECEPSRVGEACFEQVLKSAKK
ncbi:MAG: ATP-binding protein [Nodosilinea sp. WJT8-NPBG4]|nr:ATP-binding protein [Nodosilinea sp. WJT8-NPBG4]